MQHQCFTFSEILTRIEACSPEEQAIVYIVNVARCKVTITGLINCLNAGKIKQIGGRPLDHGVLRKTVERLLDQELLHTVDGSPQPGKYAPHIMRIAAERGLLPPIVRLVKDSAEKRKLGAEANLPGVGFFRRLWCTLWAQDMEELKAILSDTEEVHWGSEPISAWFTPAFEPKVMDWFKPSLRLFLLKRMLDETEGVLRPQGDVFAYLVAQNLSKPMPPDAARCLIRGHFLRGNLREMEAVLKQFEPEMFGPLRGALAAVRGDTDKALALFEAEITRTKGTIPPLPWFYGFQYLAALLRGGSQAQLKTGLAYLRKCGNRAIEMRRLNNIWKAIFNWRLKQTADLEHHYETVSMDHERSGQGLMILLYALKCAWLFSIRPPGETDDLLRIYDRAGMHLLAGELAGCLVAWQKRTDQMTTIPLRELEAILEENKSRGILNHLADAVPMPTTWEQSLTRLLCVGALPNGEELAEADKRLIWLIRVADSGLIVSAREQKLGAKGWTKGRTIALKRLHEAPMAFEYLTKQDLRMCELIRRTSVYQWRYERTEFMIDPALAAKTLVGHPRVFREEEPEIRVEVAEGTPGLHISEKQGEVVISYLPRILSDKGIQVVEESSTRVRVFIFDKEQLEVAQILSEPLLVPAERGDEVSKVIEHLSGKLKIQSDWQNPKMGKTVPPNTDLHILLFPRGQGLLMRLRVSPLGVEGSYLMPGEGGQTLVDMVENKMVQTIRDLEAEQERAHELSLDCELTAYETDPFEWILPQPLTCLQLLDRLKNSKQGLVLHWPEGEAFKVHTTYQSKSSLSLTRNNAWFEMSGRLTVDDGLVIDFRRLLELTQQNPGRFLALGDGEFVALNRRFRSFLDQLNGVTWQKGKKIRLHPLAGLAVENLADHVDELEGDEAWQEQMARFDQDPTAAVPSTLTAEPRDYQMEGFRWLSRLAHWGTGACLADDMGLGKTLQALMLLLDRAPKGPALVVAPTSVTYNWLEEMRRFAPTLRGCLLSGGKRAEQIAALGPFDVLVVSYGLLQNELESLREINWHAVVLDEAQAIKNPETNRARASRALKADFRLALTGTPLENHLGELWSLFQFLNPGLLGTHTQFNQRFAGAEVYGDKEKRLALRKLIRPFVLRRLKSQVLDELPPKTEVVLHVKLGKEEMALYEALRREAMEQVLKLAPEKEEGNRFAVLAQIMRLRRSCCHPALVVPNSPVEGAKLKVLGELLDDLMANRHKALIFSQFVDHLSLIRKFLEQRGLAYQYLDGSTPSGERRKRIKAFQAGEGDVFLISLKAGGLGLNLTAADYVIHMDPWWNPAVEDQASDRAHRIGQQRPVTVYRLITTNTIEEKILNLHGSKRELADSLLEGGDMSGRLSASDLVRLIRENE